MEGFGFITAVLVPLALLALTIALIVAALRLFSIDNTLKQILAEMTGRKPQPRTEYERAVAQVKEQQPRSDYERAIAQLKKQ